MYWRQPDVRCSVRTRPLYAGERQAVAFYIAFNPNVVRCTMAIPSSHHDISDQIEHMSRLGCEAGVLVELLECRASQNVAALRGSRLTLCPGGVR